MMFTDNPFLPVTDFVSPGFMQFCVVLMVLAVVGGTLFDLYHKRSARFFVQQRQRSRAAATRQLSGAEMDHVDARRGDRRQGGARRRGAPPQEDRGLALRRQSMSGNASGMAIM
jgi:hypothetical protein